MEARSLKLILPVLVAFSAACENDLVDPDRSLATLKVTPTEARLNTAEGVQTVQLTVSAYDRTGAPIRNHGPVTYSTSDSAVALVSSSGLVTTVGPGVAEITATLTRGVITRSASAAVSVYTLDVDVSEVVGVYDLTAMITSFDPGWGEDLTGYRYTAVLTLQADEAPAPGLGGAYADLKIIGPSGDIYEVNDSGSVISSVDWRGRFVLELVGNHQRIGLTLIVGTLVAGYIDGHFGCCGHIGGTFTATRRSVETITPPRTTDSPGLPNTHRTARR
jgi:hypothetical protein